MEIRPAAAIDLHIHSTASDGTLAPAEIIALAVRHSCRIGDKVLIEETRPLSRDKRWRVKEILEKAL